MNGQIRLNIGGIGISIRWEGAHVLNWPSLHYRDFAADGNTDAEINVRCGSLPEYKGEELVFDGEENWRLYQNESDYVMELFDTLTREKCAVGFIRPDFSFSELHISPRWALLRYPGDRHAPPHSWSFPFLMQPFGQLLLINLLSRKSGVMLHGLGINDRGRGIVFAGRSGAGKSTLAGFYRNEKGATILSDERIIIRREQGIFRVYGTPWPGDAMTVSAESVPVDSLLFIYHAPENTVSAMDAVSSLNRLFPQMFLSFWDRSALDGALELGEELVRGVECRNLGFVKDRSVIDFVRNL